MILESNNYSQRWLTADWCCCVAVDLRSRVETYQCGNDIRLNLGNVGDEEPEVYWMYLNQIINEHTILKSNNYRQQWLTADFDYTCLT